MERLKKRVIYKNNKKSEDLEKSRNKKEQEWTRRDWNKKELDGLGKRRNYKGLKQVGTRWSRNKKLGTRRSMGTRM